MDICSHYPWQERVYLIPLLRLKSFGISCRGSTVNIYIEMWSLSFFAPVHSWPLISPHVFCFEINWMKVKQHERSDLNDSHISAILSKCLLNILGNALIRFILREIDEEINTTLTSVTCSISSLSKNLRGSSCIFTSQTWEQPSHWTLRNKA